MIRGGREGRPAGAWWLARADALQLGRQGDELKGPCPFCHGTDRFHVHVRGPREGLFGCRVCRGFRAILDAAGWTRQPDRAREEHRRPAKARAEGGDAAAPAKEVWDAAEGAPLDIPRRYLARRMVWPPAGTGPDLPPSIRWLSHDRAPGPRKGWGVIPADAAGAVLFAYRRGGVIRSVEAEAVDADGRRPDRRWRRTAGERKGAEFLAARGAGPAAPLVVAEGPVSALAASWLHPGARVIGTGSADLLAQWHPSLGDGRTIIIEADGDRPGRDAARTLRNRIEKAGGRVRIEFRRAGDAADEWAAEIDESAARIEDGDGLSRAEAETAAWRGPIERTET